MLFGPRAGNEGETLSMNQKTEISSCVASVPTTDPRKVAPLGPPNLGRYLSRESYGRGTQDTTSDVHVFKHLVFAFKKPWNRLYTETSQFYGYVCRRSRSKSGRIPALDIDSNGNILIVVVLDDIGAEKDPHIEVLALLRQY